MSISFSYKDGNGVSRDFVYSDPVYFNKLTNAVYQNSEYLDHLYSANSINPSSENFIHHGFCLIVRNKSTNKIAFFFTITTSNSNVSGNYSNNMVIPFTGDMHPFLFKPTSGSQNGPKYKQDYIGMYNAIFGKLNAEVLDIIHYNEIPQNIATYFFSIDNVPVYKEVTKISYTDGSYTIVQDVLTENQAKEYAYTNLLNTYGTFYKATETDMAGSYILDREVNS